MKKINLIILLLYCSGLLAQQTKPDINMNIKVSELKSYQTLELNILYNDQKLWEYNSKDEFGILNIQAKNWFTKEGSYDLIVYLEYKDTNRSAYEDVEFYMNGNEYELKTDIEITSRKDTKPNYLSDIYLKKYYHSSDSVTINEKWTIKPDEKPHYIIHNNSQRIIHGVNDGYFFGWIEKIDSGKWSRYFHGGFCGSYQYGEPVSPRQSGISFEGFFIGQPLPFTSG